MILDTQYMQRALQLAHLGLGEVSPNPMVGAVIVHQDKIIGEGWHKQFGGPHAEVNAINSVENKALLAESTLYVTLEPCSHFGKTPPCADLIINSGIKKVVIAMEDPNPLVSGKGLNKLKEAGIQVECGVLEKEAKNLNKRFLTNILKKRPYVILKWAQTSNGFIAPGLNASKEDKQISNSLSQQLVHSWRAQEDAVIVGYNTLLFDNPNLNVRLVQAHRQPARVTWDERGIEAGNHHFFDGTLKSYVFNHTKEQQLESLQFIKIPSDNDALPNILKRLLEENVGSVVVEGGAKLLEKFISQGLWDEARICTSPKTFESGISAPIIFGITQETLYLGEDKWKVLIKNQG